MLCKPQFARPIMATWPAYRVSNSQFKTMQWRINDCYRQMRFPEPNFASDADHRAHHLPHRHRRGRALPRPGHQAMKRFCFFAGVLALRSTFAQPSPRRRPESPASATSTRAARPTMDRVVQDGRAARVHRTQRPAARGARQAARGRPDEDHRLPAGQPDRRLEERRAHRAERPRPAVDRRAGAAGGGSCYNCHQLSPQEAVLRHARAEPAAASARCAATAPRCSATSTARSTTPRPTTSARRCRASAIRARSPREQIKDLVGLLLDPASPVNQ